MYFNHYVHIVIFEAGSTPTTTTAVPTTPHQDDTATKPTPVDAELADGILVFLTVGTTPPRSLPHDTPVFFPAPPHGKKIGASFLGAPDPRPPSPSGDPGFVFVGPSKQSPGARPPSRRRMRRVKRRVGARRRAAPRRSSGLPRWVDPVWSGFVVVFFLGEVGKSQKNDPLAFRGFFSRFAFLNCIFGVGFQFSSEFSFSGRL